MPREVKVYRVVGFMHLYRSREHRKFIIEIPAVRPEHAIERVLSEIGSRHKLSRAHIEILEVKEIPESEVSRPHVAELLKLERLVIA